MTTSIYDRQRDADQFLTDESPIVFNDGRSDFDSNLLDDALDMFSLSIELDL